MRFEDGKTNPAATFSQLPAFLDIPYTDSMTQCTMNEQENPESASGNLIGFSTASVYRNYEEFLGQPERYLMEYFLQDAYRTYGYDFQVYKGKELTLESLLEK